jgi:hypothetical protein
MCYIDGQKNKYSPSLLLREITSSNNWYKYGSSLLLKYEYNIEILLSYILGN